MKLRRGIFVGFTPAQKEIYGELLSHLYKESLQWIYFPSADNVKTFSVQEIDQELGALPKHVTHQAFQDHLALWRTLNLEVPDHILFPIPAARRIIPIQCAYWNGSKGGSDSVSKLIWHNLYNPPKNMTSPQTIVTARMILILAVTAHRLIQHFTSKESICKNYYSLTSYRNAANFRVTSFRETIKLAKRWCVTKRMRLAEQMPEDGRIGRRLQLAEPIRVTRRSVHELQRSGSYLKASTNATPSKNPKRKKEYESASDLTKAEVAYRQKKCTGIPFFCEHEIETGKKCKQFQGICHVCSAKTSWVCGGCHLFLCNGNVSPVAKDDENVANRFDVPFVTSMKKDGKKKVVVARNSCYHIHHRKALEETETEREEQLKMFKLNVADAIIRLARQTDIENTTL